MRVSLYLHGGISKLCETLFGKAYFRLSSGWIHYLPLWRICSPPHFGFDVFRFVALDARA
jgi:hypothetical protein